MQYYHKLFFIGFICTLNLNLVFCQSPSPVEPALHVPSPNWQNQIIYFVMLDRFEDGNPQNNDQGLSEYDPADPRKFNGGDIQGVIDRLDYIQELGATAVWITPPVANQWWDPKLGYGGYHGYWAENFGEVDAHFGTLEDYKNLSRELHRRGMYLIQDIVVNHTGNFFDYGLEYDPQDLSAHVYTNDFSVPVTQPSQFPFNLNNPLDLNERETAIYHWTPSISDYNSAHQRLYYQVSGLDDLNTTNPVVRKAFRQVYGYWIQEVGVDGFRIDTIIYLEEDFWNDFLYNPDPMAPGIDHIARSLGKEDFLTFGEAFVGSPPLDNSGDKRVATYLGTREKPGVKSMINFPLYFTIGRVFGQGQPTRHLTYRLNTSVNSGLYDNPQLLTNFLDNHDVQRFLTGATPASLKQAVMLLMTIPGIPVIYQGTEQLFTEQRASMFSTGWGSNNISHFDTEQAFFQFTRELTQIRRNNKAFSQGDLTVLADSENGPGIFLFCRSLGDEQAVVVFNTATQNMLISNVPTGLKAGHSLQLLTGITIGENWIISEDGTITQEIPAQSAGVFMVGDPRPTTSIEAEITFNNDPHGQIFGDDFTVSGQISPTTQDLKLVLDGKLDRSISVTPDHSGLWQALVPISHFPLGKTEHSLNVYSRNLGISSETRRFSSDVFMQGKQVTLTDPAHDDHGPAGDYIIPQDPTFGGQMDIVKVQAAAVGANLQLELTMREVSQTWLPPNGFDHVVFHVFIDLPDRNGALQLPLLRAPAPAGFDWDYMLYASGWSKALYIPDATEKENFGALVIPSPDVFTNLTDQTIIFHFSADAFEDLASLSGTKVYIATWDGSGSDGFHRPLNLKGGMYEFGGTDDPRAPLIIDDTDILILP